MCKRRNDEHQWGKANHTMGYPRLEVGSIDVNTTPPKIGFV
jgi:hypothetical protein